MNQKEPVNSRCPIYFCPSCRNWDFAYEVIQLALACGSRMTKELMFKACHLCDGTRRFIISTKIPLVSPIPLIPSYQQQKERKHKILKEDLYQSGEKTIKIRQKDMAEFKAYQDDYLKNDPEAHAKLRSGEWGLTKWEDNLGEVREIID